MKRIPLCYLTDLKKILPNYDYDYLHYYGRFTKKLAICYTSVYTSHFLVFWVNLL